MARTLRGYTLLLLAWAPRLGAGLIEAGVVQRKKHQDYVEDAGTEPYRVPVSRTAVLVLRKASSLQLVRWFRMVERVR